MTLAWDDAPGTGNVTNGMVAARQDGYPRQLVNDRGMQYGPRIGFAWDVFGRGRTAVRGGFGISYNQTSTDKTLTGPYATQPPIMNNPTIYYGTLSTLTATSGLLFPITAYGLDQAGKIPSTPASWQLGARWGGGGSG